MADKSKVSRLAQANRNRQRADINRVSGRYVPTSSTKGNPTPIKASDVHVLRAERQLVKRDIGGILKG